MELERLQTMFARLIAAPEGVGAALHESTDNAAFLELIAGDQRLDAVARLEIYGDAYFYRLLDVLREDYPATLALLGETDFHNLVAGYLLEHPPSKPSIFHAGQHLAEYLRGHPLSDVQPWLPELAMLERALLESFHSADSATLEPAALAALSPEQWTELKLRTQPSARIHEFNWRVDEVVVKIGAGDPAAAPGQGLRSILIWRRRDGEAACRQLDRPERAALSRTTEAVSFAEICDAFAGAAPDLSAAELTGGINQMLARWLADGLLCAA